MSDRFPIHGGTLSLRDLWRLAQHRFAILLFAALCGGAVVLVVAIRSAPSFSTEAVIVLNLDTSAASDQDRAGMSPEWVIATERDVLGAPATIKSALAGMREAEPDVPASVLAKIVAIAGSALDGGGGPAPTADESRADLLRQIQDTLIIRSDRNSMAIQIQFESSSATFAAGFINALVRVYTDQKDEAFMRSTAQTLARLDERIARNAKAMAVVVRDIVRLQAEPNAQLQVERRQQDLAALQNIDRSLSTDRLNVAITTFPQPVWIVSPAWVPHRSNRMPVAGGAVGGAAGSSALVFLMIVIANRVAAARRRHAALVSSSPGLW